MAKWWLKALAQTVLSYAPGGRQLNDLLRRRKLYTELDDWAVKQGLMQIQMLENSGISIAKARVLELGTGWQPIIPLLFRAYGSAEVYMYDLNRYMNHHLLKATLQQLLHTRTAIANVADEIGLNGQRLQYGLIELANEISDWGMSFGEMLEQLSLRYCAPADVRCTGLPNASIRIFASRATLEHIPLPEVSEIYRETCRILQPEGAMVHIVDHSDHWQHYDRGISRINFLRHGDFVWALINWPIAYHNRARSHEHLQLIESSGFKIVYLRAEPDPKALQDAKRFRNSLVGKYWTMQPEQLAVLTTYVVARPLA